MIRLPTYESTQSLHYQWAERNVLYRYVSLTVFALFAPVIVAYLYRGRPLREHVAEIIGFLKYLPRGFRGERR